MMVFSWRWEYGLIASSFVQYALGTTARADILQLDLSLSPSNTNSRSHLLRKRGDPSSLDVEFTTNSSFTEVVVNATVGTPPQSVQLALDLGSSDLILVSSSATECKNNGCADGGSFDSNASSTFHATDHSFNSTYDGGQNYVGNYATDDVRIGQLTLNSLQIALASETAGGVYASNILGLGYSGSSDTNYSVTNIPLQLYLNNQTNIDGYSLWFDGPNKTTGQVAFGAVDTGKFSGTLGTTTINLDRSSESFIYAQIELQGIWIGTNDSSTPTSVANSSILTILDIGSSLFVLPMDVITSIGQFVGATFNTTEGVLIQNKNDVKNDLILELHFGVTEIRIPIRDLIFPYDDDNVYYAMLAGNSYGYNILGIPFFRNAYTLFDFSHNQLSIAPSVDSSSSNLTLVSANGAAGLASTYSNGQDGSSNSSSGGGLSTSAKIGIGVGIGVGVPLILAGLAAFFLVRKRRQSAKNTTEKLDTTDIEESESPKADQYAKEFKSELPVPDTTPAFTKEAELDAGADGAGSPKTAELASPTQRSELASPLQRSELAAATSAPVELPGSLPPTYELDSTSGGDGSVHVSNKI